ncbi:MAG TPA: hypothetical protein VNO52_03940 [Methylomirabilota bacterium]|nr:hypothetical protein [Methylomirabilota bacterium]
MKRRSRFPGSDDSPAAPVGGGRTWGRWPRSPLLILLGAILGVWLMGWLILTARADAPAPVASSAHSGVTPGVAAAEAISTITGVAISPLLGVSAVGAWKYWKTPVERRAALPWYGQPWFWITGLVLVGLCFLKDTAGASLPTLLKKPLDAIDAFENKVSAVLAAGAFVPLMAAFMSSIEGAGPDALAPGGPLLAAVDGATMLNLLLVPAGLVAFFVVWMASHAINMLILLSPFTLLDAALKAIRLALLALVAGLALYDPVLGALLSMGIIFVSFFIAGWSFRLMVFGSIFAWDFLTGRSLRARVEAGPSRVFLAARIERTPIRTPGRLSRDVRGQLRFEYRPWLVLRKRAVALPTGEYSVGRGLLHPSLLRREGATRREVLWWPPRFSGHEEALARAFDLGGVEDAGLRRGARAVWNWFKSLCGFGRVMPVAG